MTALGIDFTQNILCQGTAFFGRIQQQFSGFDPVLFNTHTPVIEKAQIAHGIHIILISGFLKPAPLLQIKRGAVTGQITGGQSVLSRTKTVFCGTGVPLGGLFGVNRGADTPVIKISQLKLGLQVILLSGQVLFNSGLKVF